VIQTLEFPGSLNCLNILRLFNNANAGFGSSRVTADIAKFLLSYVATLLTKANSLANLGQNLSQLGGLLFISLQEIKSNPLRGFRSNARQSSKLIN
jgi:hypothetical protein